MFLNINKAGGGFAGNKRSTIRDIGSFKFPSARRDLSEEDPDYEFHEAVRRKQENKKHSDFFMRLHGLKEKIDLFNEVFKIEAPPKKRRTLRSHVSSLISIYNLPNLFNNSGSLKYSLDNLLTQAHFKSQDLSLRTSLYRRYNTGKNPLMYSPRRWP